MPAKKLLEWSPRSRRNIEAIHAHIVADNPAAARAVIDQIRTTGLKLQDFPMIGHPGRRAGTRELVLPQYPYTLIYRLTAQRISVLAVLHQSRKYA